MNTEVLKDVHQSPDDSTAHVQGSVSGSVFNITENTGSEFSVCQSRQCQTNQLFRAYRSFQVPSLCTWSGKLLPHSLSVVSCSCTVPYTSTTVETFYVGLCGVLDSPSIVTGINVYFSYSDCFYFTEQGTGILLIYSPDLKSPSPRTSYPSNPSSPLFWGPVGSQRYSLTPSSPSCVFVPESNTGLHSHSRYLYP